MSRHAHGRRGHQNQVGASSTQRPPDFSARVIAEGPENGINRDADQRGTGSISLHSRIRQALNLLCEDTAVLNRLNGVNANELALPLASLLNEFGVNSIDSLRGLHGIRLPTREGVIRNIVNRDAPIQINDAGQRVLLNRAGLITSELQGNCALSPAGKKFMEVFLNVVVILLPIDYATS